MDDADFCDSSSDGDRAELRDMELKKQAATLNAIGFNAGLDDQDEAVIQEGFNEGCRRSTAHGKRWGRLCGKVSALGSAMSQQPDKLGVAGLTEPTRLEVIDKLTDLLQRTYEVLPEQADEMLPGLEDQYSSIVEKLSLTQ